jgi:two-component system, NtrC family, response regulator AtoC
MGSTILIIEDEQLLARNMKAYLEKKSFDVQTAGTLDEANACLARFEPDIIFADQNLPDGKGVDFIVALRAKGLTCKIIMITAYGGVKLAVEAMKAGADDYLSKPVSLDEVAMIADRLINQTRTEGSLAYYKEREARISGLEQILGQSATVTAMKNRIAQMLRVEAQQRMGVPPAVLIAGETGTGKELIARAIHYSGIRCDLPFVELNCATLPRELIESELFGHEKGAFTDAKEKKPGLIVAADGGTLFLDEVADLPPAAQAKLLKVLEDQMVRPVGSTRERKVNVRFIAATNADLEERSQSGQFRSDLMFRLSGIKITSPPLREREHDIVLLAQTFLTDLSRRYGRDNMQLTPQAKAALMGHRWPGNVRELKNVMAQAVMLTVGDEIGPDDLSLREPPVLAHFLPPVSQGATTLQDHEKELIVSALWQVKGNVSLAAELLGVSRDTLRYRMDRYGLRREQFVPGNQQRA